MVLCWSKANGTVSVVMPKKRPKPLQRMPKPPSYPPPDHLLVVARGCFQVEVPKAEQGEVSAQDEHQRRDAHDDEEAFNTRLEEQDSLDGVCKVFVDWLNCHGVAASLSPEPSMLEHLCAASQVHIVP